MTAAALIVVRLLALEPVPVTGEVYHDWMPLVQTRAWCPVASANVNNEPGPMLPLDTARVPIAYWRGTFAVAAASDIPYSPWIVEAMRIGPDAGPINDDPANWLPDQIVDVCDLTAYMDDWYVGKAKCDINRDGIVDVYDLLQYQEWWYKATAPQPAPPMPSVTQDGVTYTAPAHGMSWDVDKKKWIKETP